MMKIIISVFLVLIFLFSSNQCFAFRCGNGLVSTGDSKAKVLLECGKPTSKEKAGVKKARRYKKDERNRDRDTRHSEKRTALREKTKAMERWYYNCGDNDFIYILTFEGGILKNEETGGYGKGKSDCQGRGGRLK